MWFLSWNSRKSNRRGSKTYLLLFLLWLRWFSYRYNFSYCFLFRLRLSIDIVPSFLLRRRTCNSWFIGTKSFLATIFSLHVEFMSNFLLTIIHKLLIVTFRFFFFVFLNNWTLFPTIVVQSIWTEGFLRIGFFRYSWCCSYKLYFDLRIWNWITICSLLIFLRILIDLLKILDHKQWILG